MRTNSSSGGGSAAMSTSQGQERASKVMQKADVLGYETRVLSKLWLEPLVLPPHVSPPASTQISNISNVIGVLPHTPSTSSTPHKRPLAAAASFTAVHHNRGGIFRGSGSGGGSGCGGTATHSTVMSLPPASPGRLGSRGARHSTSPGRRSLVSPGNRGLPSTGWPGFGSLTQPTDRSSPAGLSLRTSRLLHIMGPSAIYSNSPYIETAVESLITSPTWNGAHGTHCFDRRTDGKLPRRGQKAAAVLRAKRALSQGAAFNVEVPFADALRVILGQKDWRTSLPVLLSAYLLNKPKLPLARMEHYVDTLAMQRPPVQVLAAAQLMQAGCYFSAVRIVYEDVTMLRAGLEEMRLLLEPTLGEVDWQAAAAGWSWREIDKQLFVREFRDLKVIGHYTALRKSLSSLQQQGAAALARAEREVLLKVVADLQAELDEEDRLEAEAVRRAEHEAERALKAEAETRARAQAQDAVSMQRQKHNQGRWAEGGEGTYLSERATAWVSAPQKTPMPAPQAKARVGFEERQRQEAAARAEVARKKSEEERVAKAAQASSQLKLEQVRQRHAAAAERTTRQAAFIAERIKLDGDLARVEAVKTATAKLKLGCSSPISFLSVPKAASQVENTSRSSSSSSSNTAAAAAAAAAVGAVTATKSPPVAAPATATALVPPNAGSPESATVPTGVGKCAGSEAAATSVPVLAEEDTALAATRSTAASCDTHPCTLAVVDLAAVAVGAQPTGAAAASGSQLAGAGDSNAYSNDDFGSDECTPLGESSASFDQAPASTTERKAVQPPHVLLQPSGCCDSERRMLVAAPEATTAMPGAKATAAGAAVEMGGPTAGVAAATETMAQAAAEEEAAKAEAAEEDVSAAATETARYEADAAARVLAKKAAAARGEALMVAHVVLKEAVPVEVFIVTAAAVAPKAPDDAADNAADEVAEADILGEAACFAEEADTVAAADHEEKAASVKAEFEVQSAAAAAAAAAAEDAAIQSLELEAAGTAFNASKAALETAQGDDYGDDACTREDGARHASPTQGTPYSDDTAAGVHTVGGRAGGADAGAGHAATVDATIAAHNTTATEGEGEAEAEAEVAAAEMEAPMVAAIAEAETGAVTASIGMETATSATVDTAALPRAAEAVSQLQSDALVESTVEAIAAVAAAEVNQGDVHKVDTNAKAVPEHGVARAVATAKDEAAEAAAAQASDEDAMHHVVEVDEAIARFEPTEAAAAAAAAAATDDEDAGFAASAAASAATAVTAVTADEAQCAVDTAAALADAAAISADVGNTPSSTVYDMSIAAVASSGITNEGVNAEVEAAALAADAGVTLESEPSASTGGVMPTCLEVQPAAVSCSQPAELTAISLTSPDDATTSPESKKLELGLTTTDTSFQPELHSGASAPGAVGATASPATPDDRQGARVAGQGQGGTELTEELGSVTAAAKEEEVAGTRTAAPSNVADEGGVVYGLAAVEDQQTWTPVSTPGPEPLAGSTLQALPTTPTSRPLSRQQRSEEDQAAVDEGLAELRKGMAEVRAKSTEAVEKVKLQLSASRSFLPTVLASTQELLQAKLVVPPTERLASLDRLPEALALIGRGAEPVDRAILQQNIERHMSLFQEQIAAASIHMAAAMQRSSSANRHVHTSLSGQQMSPGAGAIALAPPRSTSALANARLGRTGSTLSKAAEAVAAVTLPEIDDPPSHEEVLEYAHYLGIDLEADPELLHIAEWALTAPLPDGWTVHLDGEGNEFFFNASTSSSTYEHPMDEHYRVYYQHAKAEKQTAAAATATAAAAAAAAVAI